MAIGHLFWKQKYANWSFQVLVHASSHCRIFFLTFRSLQNTSMRLSCKQTSRLYQRPDKEITVRPHKEALPLRPAHSVAHEDGRRLLPSRSRGGSRGYRCAGQAMQLGGAESFGLLIQLGVPNGQSRQVGLFSRRGRHTPSGQYVTRKPALEEDAILDVLSQPGPRRPIRCDLAAMLLL